MPDEFDDDLDAIAELREDIVPEEEPRQIEEDTPKRRKSLKMQRMLLEQPQVAEMFREGVPINKIANLLGVSLNSVRMMYLKPTMKMRDLMAAEATRVAMHLSTRELTGESYSKLVFGLRQLNEQVEFMDGRPTSRIEVYGQGTLESLEIALFGIPRPQRIADPEGADCDQGEHRTDPQPIEATKGTLLLTTGDRKETGD